MHLIWSLHIWFFRQSRHPAVWGRISCRGSQRSDDEMRAAIHRCVGRSVTSVSRLCWPHHHASCVTWAAICQSQGERHWHRPQFLQIHHKAFANKLNDQSQHRREELSTFFKDIVTLNNPLLKVMHRRIHKIENDFWKRLSWVQPHPGVMMDNLNVAA